MPSPLPSPGTTGLSGGSPGPNFLIIGAAKAATTSLCSLLELHPQAAMVQSKEPHFFSFDKHYRLGWESYLRLYDHCRGEKAIGDASTSYSRIRHHPETLARIKRHLPDPKIIYMVRHPLERMESAYAEHMRTPGGPAFSSINDAVLRQPMIVDSSRYWEVFDAYGRAFGEPSIKVVWFEEYTARPVAIFQDVCRFLGIDDTFAPDLRFQERNSREASNLDLEWHPILRQRVIDAIREDNLRFLRHFGRPDSHWGGLLA
jgi:hypothetical protein